MPKTFKQLVSECQDIEKEEIDPDIETDFPIQEKHPGLRSAAMKLGHYGGKKGGPARAKKLSSKRRSQIASQGAKARWKGSGKSESSN